MFAASQDGNISELDLGSSSARLVRFPQKLRFVELHPTQPIFALASADGISPNSSASSADSKLRIYSFAGGTLAKLTTLAEIDAPALVKGSRIAELGFHDCHFDENGDLLWLSTPLSDDEAELLLVEMDRFSVVYRVCIGDSFGGSSFSFHSTGVPGVVSLWVAAGQDGQEVYWLKRDGRRFVIEKVDQLVNCTPPVFLENGSEFLVVDDSQSVCRYAYPTMELLGPPFQIVDDCDGFDCSVCYLNDHSAIASSVEGRVFLLDLKERRIKDEVAIEGHEPRPIGDYYPGLSHEEGIATDIAWFTKIGGVIFFVYRRDEGSGLNGWEDSLLWYSV